MENPCRELRQLLGLSQVDFCSLIGRSYQSLKVYEKHPADTPPEVIERLKTVAAERGFADWAVALSSDDWRVATIVYPMTPPRRPPPPPKTGAPSYPADHLKWHEMLEAILTSGDARAISAVQPNLILFYAWVTERQTVAAHPPSQAMPPKARKKLG